MTTITFLYDAGDTVYIPVMHDSEVCPTIDFQQVTVLSVMRFRNQNHYRVEWYTELNPIAKITTKIVPSVSGGDWVEESFLVSKTDYQAAVTADAAETTECLQKKLEELG